MPGKQKDSFDVVYEEKALGAIGHPMSLVSGGDIMMFLPLIHFLRSASSVPASMFEVLGGDIEDDLDKSDGKSLLLPIKEEGEMSMFTD